jgi:hypothetical protein
MKIHENKDQSAHTSPSCSYCREKGHNQYQCPHVAEDWKELSKYRLPVDEDGKPLKRGWYGQYYSGQYSPDPLQAHVCNNIFSAWFRACQKAMNGQIARKAKEGQTKKKATRKCGYCGSTGHTRRNCTKMDAFLKDCYKANENWRKAAYAELVEKHGISVGACVKVKVSTGWRQPDQVKMGLITHINWGALNLFSSCSKTSDFAHSPLEIKVLIGDSSYTITNVEQFFSVIGANGKTRSYWNTCNLVDIITPAPEKLPESWITDYKESFETLVKKKSEEILKKGMDSEYDAPNLWAHVQNWK